MNHNDSQQCFKREIKLFDRVITRLSDVYFGDPNMSYVTDNSENEGGNFEQMQRMEDIDRKNYEVGIHKKNNLSESSSDIT
jgi:hypothetical protein